MQVAVNLPWHQYPREEVFQNLLKIERQSKQTARYLIDIDDTIIYGRGGGHRLEGKAIDDNLGRFIAALPKDRWGYITVGGPADGFEFPNGDKFAAGTWHRASRTGDDGQKLNYIFGDRNLSAKVMSGFRRDWPLVFIDDSKEQVWPANADDKKEMSLQFQGVRNSSYAYYFHRFWIEKPPGHQSDVKQQAKRSFSIRGEMESSSAGSSSGSSAGSSSGSGAGLSPASGIAQLSFSEDDEPASKSPRTSDDPGPRGQQQQQQQQQRTDESATASRQTLTPMPTPAWSWVAGFRNPRRGRVVPPQISGPSSESSSSSSGSSSSDKSPTSASASAMRPAGVSDPVFRNAVAAARGDVQMACRMLAKLGLSDG